jgi:hypothetical protein
MTAYPIDSEETGLARQPRTGVDAPADPPWTERDDANDYATYWQARSGFFDRAPDGHRNQP